MGTDSLKTFSEWLTVGRAVKRGAHADFYAVSPDGAKTVALFDEAQTEPTDPRDSTWTVITAAERRAQREAAQTTKLPRIKMTHVHDRLYVWCGTDATAIEALRRSGFEYDARCHRWHAKRSVEQACAAVVSWRGANYAVDAGPDIDSLPAL